jgi:hypothetical protein
LGCHPAHCPCQNPTPQHAQGLLHNFPFLSSLLLCCHENGWILFLRQRHHQIKKPEGDCQAKRWDVPVGTSFH